MSGTTDSLGPSIDGLRAARQKLAAIEGRTWEDLENEGQKAHAHALQKVNMSLNKLQTADPKTLSAEFKKQEPALNKAAAKLKADLQKVDDPAEVVRVVSAVIDSISQMVTLIDKRT